MLSSLKQKISIFLLGILIILGWVVCFPNSVEATPPTWEKNFVSHLKDYLPSSKKYLWSGYENRTLRGNISNMLYPRDWDSASAIYIVIRDMTLWIMIVFFVRAWASLLFNKKPENARRHLYALLYITLWWIFIYASNRIFWDVLHFSSDQFTMWSWLEWFTDTVIWKIAFVVLSWIKAGAFFTAIIMTVITGFRVIAAWDGEKWKKLVKWLINIVVALLIIKWIDFIYYLAADTSTFMKNASDFIINAARVFGWIYWVIIVIMVIIAWYLYITDGGSWSNFKKASNVLVNILLSALVLFSFLLIIYQIFAEFQTWGDAVMTGESWWDWVVVVWDLWWDLWWDFADYNYWAWWGWWWDFFEENPWMWRDGGSSKPRWTDGYNVLED